MAGKHNRSQLQQQIAGLEAEVALLRSTLSGVVETLSSFAFLAPEIPKSSPNGASHENAQRLAANVRILRALESAAARRLRLGDLNAVLNLARAAGDWSSTHHPGLFMSHEFERVLRKAGEELAPSPAAPSAPRAKSAPRRILHVLTAAAQIGGHTRLVGRWTQWDESSSHQIVVTEELERPSPQVLFPTGVQVLESQRPADRVAELMTHMRRATLVVLHVHPYDAVAVAACGDPHRPPTVLLDHGDHVFWLGVGAADIVASLRPSGQLTALTRRGLLPTRSLLLPIPIPPTERSTPRGDSKAALGIDETTPVLLTMASPMKYMTSSAPDFFTLVTRLFAQYPAPHLVAIGPTASSPRWRALAETYGERIHPMGRLDDPASALLAADIYLDSFPFGSLTSMLEVARHDIPAVVMNLPGAGPMALDDAEATFACVDSATAWLARTERLLNDNAFRVQEGLRFGQLVRSAHSPSSWRKHLDVIYALAVTIDRAPLPAPQHTKAALQDLYLESFQTAATLGRPPETLLASYGLLPHF